MIYVLYVLDIIVAVALIICILGQNSKSAGLSGSIAGGAETLFGKKRGLDEKLARISAVLAVVFLLLTIIIALVAK